MIGEREYRWSTCIAHGYSWTPTTVASKLLYEAEILFGPMQTKFRYVGVDYSDINRPQTWYPGSSNVCILITKHLLDRPNWFNMIYQVSHEIIHVLCSQPKVIKGANYLEEGLATWFSIHGCESIIGFGLNEYYSDLFLSYTKLNNKYYKAYCLYVSLISIEPNAINILRQYKPILSELETNDFSTMLKNVDIELVSQLLEIF